MSVENQETPPANEGQFETPTPQENTPPVETQTETPQENPNENPAEGTPPESNFYTPEEMRTLQVDGIDTSRIPPEMQPLYQAMQAPITRKSQELSEQMKHLGQGETPPQEQSQVPNQQPAPSLDDIATHQTLQKLGLAEKPEPWDAGYETYVLELSDTRRDLKSTVQHRTTAINEMQAFKAGFTPEQFKSIDDEAETKMYQLLADPATKAEGQRIQQAVQSGDHKTVLAFTREVAKVVLSRTPANTQTGNTPPVTDAPSGNSFEVGSKDPSKMTNEEYRAYREAK